MNRFQNALQDLKANDRLRSLKQPVGIDFTTNDYLGLKNHTVLRQAALDAIEGGIHLGAGSSRLLGGHTAYHESLEVRAAEFFGTERALYFPTGFTANYALYSTLPSRHDVIVFDELCHASMRDGIASSNAKSMKFAHNDLNALEDALKRAYDLRKKNGQIWLSIESLYSMDGDLAPVRDVYALAKSYDAILILDEAHMTGVNKPGGRGLGFDLGENVITMHACGKAVGVAGGLICGSADIVDMLINRARPFIYSTAPMPLQALLTEKAIDLVGSEEGRQRRETLSSVIDHVRARLDKRDLTHIVPIVMGSDAAALEAAQNLQGAGYDIRAIRPPTVPEGTARLRLSLSVNTNPTDLDAMFDILDI